MTDSQKLHTAARRYCMEKYHHWVEIYSQMERRYSGDYKPEQLAIFPRYVLLQAIQTEIERLDFEALPSTSELRELLIVAAQTTPSFWGESTSEIALRAEQETRNEVFSFVQTFNCAASVEPLPYRRALFGEELESISRILREKWGKTKIYYFPLDEVESSYAPTLFAYDDVAFEEAIPEEKLIEMLRERGINRVYEIREWGDENYLQDVELMNPSYTGAEVFISSEKWDWLFYASHESSVTTGGWLTKAIQDEWPDWEAAKYNPDWFG